jgi:hypothetical protein
MRAYERPRPSRCNQMSSDVIRGHQRTSARGPPDAIRCHQMSSEVISVRASEALPMGHVARREEMDHLRGLGAPW